MKMKKKLLLSSVAVIALCICVIAGSTYALFTDSATVNIAVTAGDLNVTAEVIESTIAMRSLGDDEGEFPRSPSATTQAFQTFENGGTVSFDSETSTFAISKMTPGDEITFKIKVENPQTTNNNAIAAKCYFDWTSTVPDNVDANLLDAINFDIYDANGVEVVIEDAGDYQDLPVGAEVEFTVVASFPDAEDNNDYKNAGANINFMVVAVQNNVQNNYQ